MTRLRGIQQKDKAVKLSEMKTSDELLAEQLRDDPEFRAEWERTALARAIAVAVVRSRADRGLSQRGLASVLGMTQPQVARLERGDVNPSMDTLVRVAVGLGVELTINVTPANRKPRLVTKRALADNVVGGIHTERADVVVAAS
jgi:ribosome-binding protein aMBF1 (putative translation factor)